MLVLPVLINLHALFKKALIAISACRWVKSVMANAARLLVYGGSGRFIIRLVASQSLYFIVMLLKSSISIDLFAPLRLVKAIASSDNRS